MNKEVVKVFTDVTDKEVGRLLSRIKREAKKMKSSSVELEEYTYSERDLRDKRNETAAYNRIDNFKKYSQRFSRDQTFNKVIWRYIL